MPSITANLLKFVFEDCTEETDDVSAAAEVTLGGGSGFFGLGVDDALVPTPTGSFKSVVGVGRQTCSFVVNAAEETGLGSMRGVFGWGLITGKGSLNIGESLRLADCGRDALNCSGTETATGVTIADTLSWALG
jgi:hypothetical protein